MDELQMRAIRRAITHAIFALTELLEVIGRRDVSDALIELLERTLLDRSRPAERAASNTVSLHPSATAFTSHGPPPRGPGKEAIEPSRSAEGVAGRGITSQSSAGDSPLGLRPQQEEGR